MNTAFEVKIEKNERFVLITRSKFSDGYNYFLNLYAKNSMYENYIVHVGSHNQSIYSLQHAIAVSKYILNIA